MFSEVINSFHINLTPNIVTGCTWGDEGPFREKGITAVVQIQKYQGDGNDRNPYNHTVQDSITYINQNYLLEQTKATTAIAAQLAYPIRLWHWFYLPFVSSIN
jgi:hypothetical protein